MLQWNNIDTIMLDMDGTLLDLHFDNHFWQHLVPLRYAENQGISLNEALTHLVPLFKSKEGQLEWYCVEYWSQQLQLDIVALKKEIAHLIDVLPHATDFLQQLADSGKNIMLVTNAHQKSLKLKMEKTRLDQFFDHIICSHDLGLPKEHPKFWPSLKQQQYFRKSRSLLVDDSLAVLNCAQQYGIAHLLAISKPDSTQPQKTCQHHRAIRDFSTLKARL